MRDALAALEGQRITVQAPVLRFSARLDWRGARVPTLLLGPVTLPDGAVLCDHLWLRVGTRVAALDLVRGDVLQFSGRVAPYRHSFRREPGRPATWRENYGLRFPSKCVVLARALPPEPAPAPLPKPEPAPVVPARTRILTALAALGQEEPISLPNLFVHAGTAPSAFLHQIHKMAKAGTLAFTATGRVYCTAERSQP